MPPSGVQVVRSCKYRSCDIRAIVQPFYPWIWLGGALGCFALGPRRPWHSRLVSFSFSAKTKDLFIRVMVIKKTGKGLGLDFRYCFLHLSQWFTTKHVPDMFINSDLGVLWWGKAIYTSPMGLFNLIIWNKQTNKQIRMLERSWCKRGFHVPHLLASFFPPGNKDKRFGDYEKLWGFPFWEVKWTDFYFTFLSCEHLGQRWLNDFQ